MTIYRFPTTDHEHNLGDIEGVTDYGASLIGAVDASAFAGILNAAVSLETNPAFVAKLDAAVAAATYAPLTTTAAQAILIAAKLDATTAGTTYAPLTTTAAQAILIAAKLDAATAASTYGTIATDALKAPIASPAFTGTPTGITKAHVGLGSVDNTSDAGKPVSTAQASADALKANIAGPTFTGTVAGITATMVGLGSVNNTADSAKPVSTAQAAADTAAAARANHTGTQLAATVSDFSTAADARVALNAPAAASTTGTYAARPAANAVVAGTTYNATDVPEQYRSNATAWSAIGSGGREMGYAAITAMFSTMSATPVAVTGLSVSFVAGERPVEIRVCGDLANTGLTSGTVAGIWLGGVTYGAATILGGPTADRWHTCFKSARVSGLTPGTSYTASVMLNTSDGSTTARIGGAAGNPSTLSVITL